MRYTGPVNRLARREGIDLSLKSKPVEITRPMGGGKLSEFGKQLRAKQVAKRLYGVTERVFRNYYKKAAQAKGDTGNGILTRLEIRLDNVVYRAGFALTRPQSRQMVNHGLFLVNSKKIDIPSYEIKVGDVITVRERSFDHPVFLQMMELKSNAPKWLKVDLKKRMIEVSRLPESDELEKLINIQAIVESYSR